MAQHARVPDESSAEQGGEASLRSVWRLLPLLWPEGQTAVRWRVVGALLALLAAKGLGVLIPWFYRDAVDALGIEGGPAAIPIAAIPIAAILAYGLARVLSLGFGQLRELLFERVEQQVKRGAAVRVLSHLHDLPLAFHLGRQTGGLGRAVDRGTSAIGSLLSMALFNVLPTLLELGLVMAVLGGFFAPRFAAVLGLTVSVYVGFTIAATEWRTRFRRRLVEADRAASTRALDSLLNFETVKYFGNEALEVERYDGALRRYEEAAVKSQSALGALNFGQSLIIAAGLTALMAMAAEGIIEKTMSVGDFVLVNTYLMQLAQPLGVFGWVYRSVRQATVDMHQMFALLDEKSTILDAPSAPPLSVSEGHVRFEGVSFGYDERRPILSGVSFEVPPGHTVALVGQSGAGKSTIGRLLFRFWDPDEGRVTIDGVDIRSVTQSSLRAKIGVVPQDTVLFNDTLAYNLEYAKPGASMEELREAARQAAILDFIERTPDGWMTRVGERGLKLSGGEKQRIAIARVFLSEPPILLLDEATSALDSRTELTIQGHLREASRGRTTLVIAHRLSTVVHADAILVLEGGRIVERGRHGDLLAAGGVYAQMWRQQGDG